MGDIGEWRGTTILVQRGRTGSHSGVTAEGLWFQHFYPPADDQCWCGWKPAEVTATARQCGVMNSDGTWTFEECRHAESKE